MRPFVFLLCTIGFVFSCQDSKNSELDLKITQSPTNLKEAYRILSADDDFNELVKIEKHLRKMLVTFKVDVGDVMKRMKEEGVKDICLLQEEDLKDIDGGIEYSKLICKKISLVKSVYSRFPFLNDMSTSDRISLFYKDARVSVTPEEVLNAISDK